MKNFFDFLTTVSWAVRGMILIPLMLQAAPDPNFHIYIAYGQSNMAGAAKDFTDYDKAEHPRFKMFATTSCSNLGRPTVGEIYPAIPPMFQCYEGLSVADWFGRHMADSLPNVTIGIIPVAVGGTSIKLYQSNEYQSYLASAESWLVNWAKSYGDDGNAMGRILEVAKKAQEVGVIKGIIFHQGETDGGLSDWESRVASTYNTIIKELGLNAEEVPFVAGEMLDGGACDGMSDRVNKLPQYISNAYVVSSDNLPGASDRLHFTVEGYRGMGERYAQVMLKHAVLEEVEPVPQQPFNGVPVELPGKIEAENFDIPGVGSGNNSFNELDSENHGDSDYRSGTGVDLYNKATGVIVGYNQEGEWLEYTVNITEAGDYTMFASVASGSENSSFQLSLDGTPITSVISVPQNAGEENYDDYSYLQSNVELPEGLHILRLAITGSWLDVDYLTFVKGKDATTPESFEETPNSLVSNLNLYPSAEANYQVFNMQGKLIAQFNAKTLQEAEHIAKSSSLGISPGIYLLRALTPFGLKQKIITPSTK